ncbi:DIAMINE N-ACETYLTRANSFERASE [Salix koriyanagi]|uniref:DIAMINE N-ACETYLTRANSFERASE n=1 Tax=Salix koriyanagi TaxID=2511006 RepID=A0A9Q1AE31_9ROSI|nr:DIAMINE N-ACETYLTRANSFERASE [Salix koriyanagi]
MASDISPPALASFAAPTTLVGQHQLYTRTRLATPADVPHIHKLMYQMAVFQNDTHLFTATESSLASTLFNSPPFQSFTIFILELSSYPFKNIHSPAFLPIERAVLVDHVATDPDAETFKSSMLLMKMVITLPWQGSCCLCQATPHLQGSQGFTWRICW